MDTRPPLVSREQRSSRGAEAAPRDLAPKPAANWSVEQIYHAHHRRVYGLALRLLGNEADAEDVAQEVLLQVVRKLDTFRGHCALPTWLYSVTLNAVRHLHRKRGDARKRRVTIEASGGDLSGGSACDIKSAPDRLALDKELSRCIERAIARLPREYRAVYVAADVDGLAIEEISARLGLSQAAVKSRLHRGRTRLRAILSDYVLGKPA